MSRATKGMATPSPIIAPDERPVGLALNVAFPVVMLLDDVPVAVEVLTPLLEPTELEEGDVTLAGSVASIPKIRVIAGELCAVIVDVYPGTPADNVVYVLKVDTEVSAANINTVVVPDPPAGSCMDVDAGTPHG